jgi:TPR repeat protein
MPTFQSVIDAAGAPPISPFEPPAKKDEDEELKEFVANFFYKPPEETVDELTMRSEVPVIDTEEPAQFHHASFDDDVAPPPEAHAHPDGDAFIPAAEETNRSRFLDLTERPQVPAPDQPQPGVSSTSFLHLDEPAHVAGQVPPAKSRWLMWSSLVALLLIFGALGFLEGRSAMTHEFPGPLEIAREQYAKLRQRISQMTASAPSPAPAADTSEPVKQAPSQSEPSTTNQTAASTPTQPENTLQSAASPPQTTGPATAAPQTQPPGQTSQPEANQQSQASAGAAPTSNEVPKAEPPKPLDAPPPRPANKPQPGQAELAKAMDASDPAATAAWLWKATSRGNPEAPVRLADMYIKGKGVPHSCEQALVLLRSAAVKPNAPARNRLAALYANGTCVARDRVRAYEFLSSALEADPTSEWADQSRKELWNQMNASERAQIQKPD